MKKFIAIAIALVVLFAALSGCTALDQFKTADSPVSSQPSHIVVVYCNRNNNAPPAFGSSKLNDIIMESCTSYGSAAVVTTDGRPVCHAALEFNEPEKQLSKEKIRQIAEDRHRQTCKAILSSSASFEESDLLEAVSLAARTLASKGDGTKSIIVVDNGLSTCGYVDFAGDNLLRADNSVTIRSIQSESALPDLRGIDVVFFGIGDISAPQEKLTPGDVIKLKSVWEDILTSAGAETVSFEPDLPGAEILDREALPYVTPVKIIQPADAVITKETGTVSLSEDKVGFKPDTAEYIEPRQAMSNIKPVAEYLKNDPSMNIVLAGTTATSGTNNGCRRLSLERARTVSSTLIDLGVSSGQIECVGLGYEHDFHIPDLNPDGSQNENAQSNRVVFLFTDRNSPDAQYALSTGLR